MIEKEKYLYWLNESESKFEQDIVYREMYSRVGHIFHSYIFLATNPFRTLNY